MKQKIVITAREERFMKEAIDFLRSMGESVEEIECRKISRLANRYENGNKFSHDWSWITGDIDKYKQAGFIHLSMPEDFEELKAMYGMEKNKESFCPADKDKTLADLCDMWINIAIANVKCKEAEAINEKTIKAIQDTITSLSEDKTTYSRCNAEKANYLLKNGYIVKAPEYGISWSLEDSDKSAFSLKSNIKPIVDFKFCWEDYEKQKRGLEKAIKDEKVVFTNSIGEQFTKKYLKKHKVFWVRKSNLKIHNKICVNPMQGGDFYCSEIFKTKASAEKWKKNYITKQAKKGMKWNGKEFVEMKLSEMEYHAKDREDLRDLMMKLPIEILNEGFNTDIVYNFVSFSCGRINNFTKESHSGHNLTEVTKEVFINAAKKYICE